MDYLLNNQGRQSPELLSISHKQVNKDFDISFTLKKIVASDWELKAEFKSESDLLWNPASIYRPGNLIHSSTIPISKNSSTLFNTVRWISRIDTSSEGTYQIRLTPVVRNQPVGRSIATNVRINQVNQLNFDILPTKRIITPADIGYNDKLEVLFRLPKGIHAPAPPIPLDTSFSIFDLGGYLVYSAPVNSYEVLSNEWSRYTWNGRNENKSDSQIAERGIYIYLLTVGGNVKKGTFAIARK
ncbi:TPA: hypothetical protein EYO57_36610 [Candidatus Poribacteria bacterium]|nr:hypothetical protein [Candidatus Poribacteria bacterium]